MRLRVPSFGSRPRILTRVCLPILALAWVPTAPGVTLAAGTFLNRSEVVSDPVCAKSWVLRLFPGTPTAAVPWISEPVTRTCSGTCSGLACAVCACATCCACAAAALTNVRNDAVPNSVVSRDAVGFMDAPGLIRRTRSQAGRPDRCPRTRTQLCVVTDSSAVPGGPDLENAPVQD